MLVMLRLAVHLLSSQINDKKRAKAWRRNSKWETASDEKQQVEAEREWASGIPAREAKRMIEESWVWAHLSHGLRRPARRRPPRRRQQRILIMMPSSSQPLGTRRAGSVAAGRGSSLLPGRRGGGLRSLPATTRVSTRTTARERPA